MFVNSLLGGLRNLSRAPALFFHRHGHRDRLQRIVGGVAGGGDNLVQGFDAAKVFPEHGVASVEPSVLLISAWADRQLLECKCKYRYNGVRDTDF